MKTIRSSSFFGFSTIYVIFDEDVEFYWSRSRVLEKLASLPGGTLPDGVQPTLGPDASPTGADVRGGQAHEHLSRLHGGPLDGPQGADGTRDLSQQSHRPRRNHLGQVGPALHEWTDPHRLDPHGLRSSSSACRIGSGAGNEPEQEWHHKASACLKHDVLGGQKVERLTRSQRQFA